jgi:RHH-type proline utilization regulon transcriptional repressor/proline dehydrogenase/delta 1-pyrroline-5-carboxylate dehydrogenase
VLVAGAQAVWPDDELGRRVLDELSRPLRPRVRLAGDPLAAEFDAVLLQTDTEQVRAWTLRLAQRPGPVIGMQACAPGARHSGALAVERLLVERTLSVNTAAAGGNASLMTIG